METNQTLAPDLPDRQKRLQKTLPFMACPQSGSALLPTDHKRQSLILIDAESHLDCRAARFRAHGNNDVQDIDYQWANTDFGGDCVHALQQHVINNRLGLGPVENTGADYLNNILIEEAVYASDAEQRRIRL